ncbi:ParA family protein [Sporolactobacillus shoreae]|uniref:ParA family protein n=1 Tax=Sporolactobacillus shoreae TaxID=1465501 RepID=A0A4Z0GK04_9BACL|nr:ParA family protein [Sporolactobacillus shoreae]TGA96339.1 ParA family protein [Sporolactobacillus shoreae]
MTRILAVSNNKGGVLKTSLSVNLAGLFALDGKKVLIVDGDNQGNVSLSFGKNPDVFETTIYDVMVGKATAKESIVKVYEGIDILPANDDLQFLEFDVLTDQKKYKKPFHLLKSNLSDLNHYDIVIVDGPPNLGLMAGNILNFAHEVLIPFQPEKYSMRSLVKMLNFIVDFKSKINHRLEVNGVVATLVDRRTALHDQILQECRKYCLENHIKLYDTVIPRSIRGASGIAYENLPVTLIQNNNVLKDSYSQLYNELTLN